MELWNDFEGKTVDGRFHLDHLIGPKGRSAYFTTKDEGGGPAAIRLIESLNDEEEILARWRMVLGMKQEHLLGVLACGQTVLDGTHLVYAVMEPTDMELADVLRERALSGDETRQVALSVADGLQALHEKGLVHEHVEAENVLASGETVKLRSDVVREAPEGAEGERQRSRDVRDLSLLVHQCLTRSRRLGETRLPGAFDEVVRRGESGAWGLGEIVAALRPVAAAALPVPVSTPAAVVPAAAMPVRPPVLSGPAAGSVKGTAGGSTEAPGQTTAPVPGGAAAAGTTMAAATTPAAVASGLETEARPGDDGVGAHLRRPRVPDRIVMEPEREPKRTALLVSVAAGFLLLVLLGLHLFRASRAGQTRSVMQDAPTAVSAPDQSSANRPPAHDPASAPVPQPTSEKPAAGGVGRTGRLMTGVGGAATDAAAQWRVVAFTYNREDQAAQKARALAAKHAGLKPEVFSPSGRAPYLVTLGGWMSMDRAFALRSKARSEGLPRDVYAQNYRGRNR